MAAGFHHFKITRESLRINGYSDIANLLAHYASVYADGLKGKIAMLNIEAGILYYNEIADEIKQYLVKSPLIDYDIEDLTQQLDDQYQLWHCCRNKDSQFTPEERVQQTGEFAWGEIFFASENKKISDFRINDAETKAFGQGVHAFQDIFVHKGVVYNGDIIDEHDELLDVFPGDNHKKQMLLFTNNLIRIYRLLTDDNIDSVNHSRISLIWMSSEQIDFLKNKSNLRLIKGNEYEIINS